MLCVGVVCWVLVLVWLFWTLRFTPCAKHPCVGPPPPDPHPLDSPKFRSFFPSPAPSFALFVSHCVFSWFFLVGLSCEAPAAQTCTIEGPGASKNHQNSTRRHTVRNKKSEIGGGRRKKTRNFGKSSGSGSAGRGSGGGGSGARWSKPITTPPTPTTTTTTNNTHEPYSQTTNNHKKQQTHRKHTNTNNYTQHHTIAQQYRHNKNGLAKIGLAKVGHNRGRSRHQGPRLMRKRRDCRKPWRWEISEVPKLMPSRDL